MANIPAISGLDDATQARVVLFQSGQQVHAPVLDIGLQPLDATLTTIAALTGAADKSIYFTGTDTAALFDLKWSTWTPTLTNTTNVAASTSAVCHYIRIGARVICFGQCFIDPTAAAPTATVLDISLPIASSLGVITDLAGTANATSMSGVVYADFANDRAELQFNATSAANNFWTFVFGYQII